MERDREGEGEGLRDCVHVGVRVCVCLDAGEEVEGYSEIRKALLS